MRFAAAFGTVVVLGLAAAPARAETGLPAQANEMLAAMRGDAHRVALLLRAARASRKTEPIRCVDGSLSRIDADVRHGRDDLADLRAALAKGDTDAARRALARLASRREAAREASFDADACMAPALATDRDRTTVRVVAPALPADRAVFARMAPKPS